MDAGGPLNLRLSAVDTPLRGFIPPFNIRKDGRHHLGPDPLAPLTTSLRGLVLNSVREDMPFVGLIKNVPLAPAIIKYLRFLTDPTRSAHIVLPYLFALHARRRLKLPVICQHASTFEQSTGFRERQYKRRRL